MAIERTTPREHPPAWGSKLWNHIDEIRSMRVQRKTWAEVAQALESKHGLKITYRTIRRFYARYTDLKNRGKLPLGFDAHMPKPETCENVKTPNPPTFCASDPNSLLEDYKPLSPWDIDHLRK